MQSIEFTLCKADPDVWMCKAVNEEGVPYWEYIFLYTDDVLCVLHKPVDVLAEIGRHFKLKEKSIGEPKLYLGGTMSKQEVHSPVSGPIQAWGFSSSQYVQSAVNNVVKYLKEM